MATDSNTGFHQRTVPSSFYNRHIVSFQSGAAGSSAGMIPAGVDGFVGVNSTAGMVFTGNPSGISHATVLIPGRNTARCVQLDPVIGLKDGAGLSVDWTFEEQTFLEEGLVKYANEPNIMRYIKIAAMLQNKTVRDVALRCRWMTNKESGKRRKQEEYYIGKKVKDKREKQVNCSSRTNVVSSQLSNPTTSSLIMHHMDSRDGISCEAPNLDGAMQFLLEENYQLLGQIMVNLDTSKLQENVDLFFYMKNNVGCILNRMSKMPGIMSQMPPLPVSINEELVGAILPDASKALMFGPSSSVHLKQEPR